MASLDSNHRKDWIQDATLERNRRLRNATALDRAVSTSWTQWARIQLKRATIAGQSWFVISLAGTPYLNSPHTLTLTLLTLENYQGIFIGINAAAISIVTEWLSDIKMGYCTDGWWLNQQFCCWEEEMELDSGCDAWSPWSQFFMAQWIIYVVFAVGHVRSLSNLQ